jgi:imidazole glycerol-phosphate synthase subunit HisF
VRYTRVIPVLLIHNGGVYKTNKFKSPVYIGDPINAIRLFNDLEVDEICVLNIDASKLNTTLNYDFIEDMANEAFMPFSYGGGVKTVDQANQLLKLGIEKIVINHAVQNNNKLISECAEKFGSQSIVVSIDYRKKLFNGNVLYDHVRKKTLQTNVVDAALMAEKSGAGEIIVNSVDRDGLMSGMDVDLIKSVADVVDIPIVACGGAGNIEHMQKAEEAGASAIAAGSMFIFHGRQNGVLINYPKEEQLSTYLK